MNNTFNGLSKSLGCIIKIPYLSNVNYILLYDANSYTYETNTALHSSSGLSGFKYKT